MSPDPDPTPVPDPSHLLERAVVLGAGTMGNGIAQVCAQAGLDVVLYDLAEEPLMHGLANVDRMLAKAIEKGRMEEDAAAATRKRIRMSTDLAEACEGAQVVIEAVPEKLELKRSLMAAVEEQVAGETLLASNTSSLSIDAIAGALHAPSRFLGLHFFNPVPVMKLLEVVVGRQTADADRSLAVGLAHRLGKEPIVVADSPGFASSRLGVCIGLEAIRMLEEEVASAEDIDKAMTLGYRHPMGPLRLTDLVGLDVRLGIAEYLEAELGPRFAPPQLLRDMVASGKLGQKSGKGFYAW
ncbi:MAG: 3-hydroxyacyl-CoA dehydrogenase family protein [Planctomycetota bacterium]|jgi:3-hydroxybutyryl-CoA dehydrogenase